MNWKQSSPETGSGTRCFTEQLLSRLKAIAKSAGSDGGLCGDRTQAGLRDFNAAASLFRIGRWGGDGCMMMQQRLQPAGNLTMRCHVTRYGRRSWAVIEARVSGPATRARRLDDQIDVLHRPTLYNQPMWSICDLA